MKVLAVTTAFAGLTAVSALPFWHTHQDPPELTVAEWQAIQTGDFNALPVHAAHQPASLWDRIKSVVSSPFGVPDTLVEAIGSYVDSYVDDNVDYFDDDSEKTIWQLLQEDEEHYSKIVKLLKLEETGKAIKVLDNRDLSITFFAPENSGIPDPHHHDDDDDDDDEDCTEEEDEDELFESLMTEPSASSLLEAHERFLEGDHDHDDDDKKKRRHKVFQFILRSVLKYHGLPESYSTMDLAKNNTFATALRPKFGANDGRPLRIRVEKKLVPPTLEINFYAKVSLADVKAKNGYIHRIDHPLLPPPAILDAAFLFPRKFSTWTSAVQKVHGQHHVSWHLDHEASKKHHKPVFHGNPALTYFIPTNDAFAKLPEKLVFFLFSPFGERVLAKVLAYHGLPEQVVFTEHVFDVKHPHHHDGDHKHHHDHDGKHKHHHDHDGKHKHRHDHDEVAVWDEDPSFHKEFEFVSGLKKEKLKLVIDKSKVLPVPGATKTTLSVNDVTVDTFDVPALNGVAHVLPEVLRPPHKHKDPKSGFLTESTWDNWEDWIVEWAESA